MEHEEGADDRQDPHHERQTGGDHAAEHEHRQQQDDREREQLATQQVFLDLRVDLPENLGEAADAHGDGPVFARESRREPVGRVVHGVFVAPQRSDDERLTTVRAAERRRVAEIPVRDGASDAALGPEPGGERIAGGGDLGVVDRAALRRDKEDEVGLLLPEFPFDGVPGPEASEEGSSKPPLLKRDATPPPSTAAAMKNTTVPKSTALAVGDGETTEASEQDRAPTDVCYR